MYVWLSEITKDQPGHYLQVLPDFKEMGIPDGKRKMLIFSSSLTNFSPRWGSLPSDRAAQTWRPLLWQRQQAKVGRLTINFYMLANGGFDDLLVDNMI